MRRALLIGLGVSVLAVGPVWAGIRVAGGPSVTGPLSLAAGGGCQAGQGCAFDYVLDPAATSDPNDSWHAFWLVTSAAGAPQKGGCTTEVTDAISWTGPGGTKPLAARTFPSAGTSTVSAAKAATLTVDAGGAATRAAGLAQRINWPPGLVTTTAGPGYMTVVWQGRASRAVQLGIAAEVKNPDSSWGQLGGVNTTGVGVPCSDLAPPGTTFLARLVPSTIEPKQTAWLQLRIPDTYFHWTLSAKAVSVAQLPGKATVVISGTTVFGKSKQKPIIENMSDRTSLALSKLFPGSYRVSVTLHGPSGTRRYTLPLVVR